MTDPTRCAVVGFYYLNRRHEYTPEYVRDDLDLQPQKLAAEIATLCEELTREGILVSREQGITGSQKPYQWNG